jgi:hypothetical protein
MEIRSPMTAVSDLNPEEKRLWSSAGKVGAPFVTKPCACRADHAPNVPWTHRHHVWPLFAGGPDIEDNVVYVCPATHDWTHVIWRIFEKSRGTVPRRRTWPHYAYELAVAGWRFMQSSVDPLEWRSMMEKALGPCDWCGQHATVSWSRTNNGWRTTIYACDRHSHEQRKQLS